MAIPDFQQLMLPILQMINNNEEWTMQKLHPLLIEKFQLTQEDIKEKLPSGRAKKFNNRVSWAKIYLQRAGLIESPKRAVFKITPLGTATLVNPPEKITIAYLHKFADFNKWRSEDNDESSDSQISMDTATTETPEETLEKAHKIIEDALAIELLEKIKASTPSFFEQLVVDLLEAMGYGSQSGVAGRVVGKSGDEGIDGVITEDKLGLEIIYLQAKKWEGTVGRPEIQKFVGALHGQKARKGVFITTSKFSAEALQYAQNIDVKVVLIDGEKLVRYMIDFNLGVSHLRTYTIKTFDSDYFE